MRSNVRSWAGAALLLGLAVPAGAQNAQNAQNNGFPWWKDPKVVQELALTAEQSNKVDTIFRTTLPQLRQQREELDRQEAELSRRVEANTDEAVLIRHIDKVEAARASLNKARTVMMIHMRQVLGPKQNAKFNAVFEQYRRDNPRPAAQQPEAPRPPDSRGRTPSR